MKQLFLFLSIALAAMILSSCSENNEPPAKDELVGTVWSQTVGNRTDTFYFALDNKCTVTWQIGDVDPVTQNCRYSYKAPEVTIDAFTQKFTGRIENETLFIRFYDQDLALKKIR